METIRLAPGKKNAARLQAGPYRFLSTESGFLLIPSVAGKTWSPVGQTPILHHRYGHDRISAISGISSARNGFIVLLYCHLYEDNIQNEEVATFLRHLLRQINGHLIVLLDNGQAHRGDSVQELLGRTTPFAFRTLSAVCPRTEPG